MSEVFAHRSHRFRGNWLVMTMVGRSALRLLVPAVLAVARSAHAQEAPDATPEVPAPELAPPPPPTEAPPTETPAAPAPRRPAQAPRFGEAGEYVVTAAAVVGLASQQFAKSTTETFGVRVSPGLDVFVVRSFSLGFDLDVGYDVTKRPAAAQLGTTKTTTFAFGPRFGLNVAIGERFSFYPRVTFGVASVATSSRAAGMPERSDSERAIFVSAFAPLLFHAAPHFFFGAGPSLRHQFAEAASGTGDSTTVAGQILVGGWWGGPANTEPATSAAGSTEAPRFGARGQWVFTGAVGGRVAHATVASSSTAPNTITTVSLAPGVDYFVASHVSIGGAALFGYSGTSTTTRTSLGVGPRLGAELPLGRSFSLYPRVVVSYVHVLTEAPISRGDGFSLSRETSTSSGDIVALSAYVPLLVHVAPHFFIGFGPSFTRDLLRTFGSSTGDLGTRIGADLEIGGWL